MMEFIVLLLAFVVVAVCALVVHRHQKAAAWNRELEQAFGSTVQREMPRHRSL